MRATAMVQCNDQITFFKLTYEHTMETRKKDEQIKIEREGEETKMDNMPQLTYIFCETATSRE